MNNKKVIIFTSAALLSGFFIYKFYKKNKNTKNTIEIPNGKKLPLNTIEEIIEKLKKSITIGFVL